MNVKVMLVSDIDEVKGKRDFFIHIYIIIIIDYTQ